jgi:hypothetical protein
MHYRYISIKYGFALLDQYLGLLMVHSIVTIGLTSSNAYISCVTCRAAHEMLLVIMWHHSRLI